jgi:hypothetical protein
MLNIALLHTCQKEGAVAQTWTRLLLVPRAMGWGEHRLTPSLGCPALAWFRIHGTTGHVAGQHPKINELATSQQPQQLLDSSQMQKR